MHRSEECDRRRTGSTDLDDDVWDVGQHGVRDVADEADQSGPDQEAPEEPDSPAVIPLGDFSLGRHRAPSRL